MAAVKHVHSDMDSMHRDIKLDNVLVANPEDAFPRVLLSGFQHAKSRGPRCGLTTTEVGMDHYIAPEILLRVLRDLRYDGKTADMWSCGVCLHVMLYGGFVKVLGSARRGTGAYAVDPRSIMIDLPEFHEVGREGGVMRRLSADCLSLLDRLLQPDPARRAGVQEALNHRWFRADVSVTEGTGSKTDPVL